MGSGGPIMPRKELHATPGSWRIAGRGLKVQEALQIGSDTTAKGRPVAQVLHRQKAGWVANECANNPLCFVHCVP